jgi:hypothetical protein
MWFSFSLLFVGCGFSLLFVGCLVLIAVGHVWLLPQIKLKSRFKSS